MEHSTRTMPYLRRSARTAVPRAGRPRLTGLGAGVLAIGLMVLAGWLSRTLGGAPALYGVFFLLTGSTVACWVRPVDLVCAPVAAPLAFAAGLTVSSPLTDLVPELALGAPWLFTGTLLTAALALARRVRWIRSRRRERVPGALTD